MTDDRTPPSEWEHLPPELKAARGDDLVARLRQQALDNVPDCGYVAHMLETKAADEIERLQATAAEGWNSFYQTRIRAEAAERDAARYRYLRDSVWSPELVQIVLHRRNSLWDKTIDAEMERTTKTSP